jgi:hypothetical protein
MHGLLLPQASKQAPGCHVCRAEEPNVVMKKKKKKKKNPIY